MNRLGPLLTLTLAVLLATAAIHVAATAPLYSGAHLIAAPLLITAAWALTARVGFIHHRKARP